MNRATLLLVTALGPASWGTTYVVTTELLPPDRPLFTAAVRTLPAGLLLVAIGRTLPRGRWWWRAAVLAALNIAAFQALLFVSAYRLPGGVAATFGAAGPLVVAGLAAWLLAERPSGWQLGSGLAGVLGVGLVVLGPAAGLDPVGVGAGVLGVLAMALGTVLVRRWGRPVGLLAYTGWQLALGGLVLAPLSLVVEGAPPAVDGTAAGGYLWLAGVGTLVAYALWFRGLALLPAGQAAFLPLLSPVVATVLGWLVLAEGLTLVQAAGFVVALGAIAAGQRTGPPALLSRWPSWTRRDARSSSHTAGRPTARPSTPSGPTSWRSTRAPRGSSATCGSPRTATSSASTTAVSTGSPTPAVSSRRCSSPSSTSSTSPRGRTRGRTSTTRPRRSTSRPDGC
jgi:probable blue pigment (indigoidine) exporter